MSPQHHCGPTADLPEDEDERIRRLCREARAAHLGISTNALREYEPGWFETGPIPDADEFVCRTCGTTGLLSCTCPG
jgi:hypothetical protein